ncbi:MAG: restriction endonuclease subunit S [Cecembia sp.]
MHALELLELISRGKQKVLKESKIKSEKPIDDFNSAEVKFELPDSWVWVRFASAAYICRGGSPRPIKSYLTDDPNGINWIKIGDTKGKTKYIEACEEKIIPEGLKMSRLVEPGDFILSNSMSFGRPYIMKTKGCIHDGWLLIREVKEAIDQDFLYHMLSSPYVYESFKESAAGGVVQNLNIDKVRQTLIPIPPLAEQKAIVAIVNQLFKEVEQLENLTKKRIQLKSDFVTSALNQLNQATELEVASQWELIKSQFGNFFTEKENIKKLREAVLQLAVQGKLTHHWRAQRKLSRIEVEPASVLLEKIKAEKEQLIKAGKIKKEKPLPPITEGEIPYELPEGWVWCRFQDLIKDLRYGTSKKCDYGLGDNPVLRIPNVSNGKIDINDLKSTNLTPKEAKDLSLDKGDILLIRSNGSAGLVGRSAPVEEIGVGFSFAGYLVRARLFLIGVSNNYLHLVLESSETRKAIEGPLRTTSGVKNINSTEISSLCLTLPPIEEQQAIVEKVNGLMALCDQLEQEIETHQTTQEEWLQSCLREVV